MQEENDSTNLSFLYPSISDKQFQVKKEVEEILDFLNAISVTYPSVINIKILK